MVSLKKLFLKIQTMHMSSPVLTRKRLSGVSVVDVWINKAEVLLHLGFYQPARALLSEAHKDAKVSLQLCLMI